MRFRNDAVAALAAAVLLVGLIVAALLVGCSRQSASAPTLKPAPAWSGR